MEFIFQHIFVDCHEWHSKKMMKERLIKCSIHLRKICTQMECLIIGVVVCFYFLACYLLYSTRSTQDLN